MVFFLAIRTSVATSRAVKFQSALLLSVILFGTWSCKPREAAPAAAAEPAAPAPAPAEPTAKPEAAPEPASPEKLGVGSKVSLDAVKAATWIQGAPPQSFEPGLVYVFEAWATWCGPCIRVIPHMNDLHKKYHDKGLRVYGMNVFEDGEEKVTNFVKNKGAEMSYPVAYTGKGSAFDKQWMKAAGVRGIPHSFVVIDGVLVLSTHPATLKDELIEKLLKGGDEAAQAIKQANPAENPQDKMRGIITKYRQAVMKGDIAAMDSMIANLEKEDPKNLFLGQMKIDLMLVKKDWVQLEASLVEPPSNPAEATAVNMIGTRLALPDQNTSEAPATLVAKVARIFSAKVTNNPQANPMEWLTLSSLQFKTGDPDAAKQSARSAIEAAEKMPAGRGIPPAVFQKFSQELAAGRLPSMNDFSLWIQESMQKRPIHPPVPAEP